MSAHLAHVQAFTKTHHPFIRSWQTPSLTVALKWCRSDSLLLNLRNALHSRDYETLNAWTFEMRNCENPQGLQAKHMQCAGCLVEELRPLTHWLFPKLSKTPPLMGMIHPSCRLLGPANAQIESNLYKSIHYWTKLFEAKAGQRTNLNTPNVAKSRKKLSQSTRLGNCFKSLSASKNGTKKY